MYEDIVAAARNSSEAAVRESQERVDMAVSRAAAADRAATEATKAVGERWVNRINAMRRRAADRNKPAEHQFGPEDDTQTSSNSTEPELTSLTEPSAVAAPEEPDAPPVPRTPDPNSSWFDTALTFEDEDRPAAPPPQPPRRQPQRRPQPTVDEDDDYSPQSWMQGG